MNMYYILLSITECPESPASRGFRSCGLMSYQPVGVKMNPCPVNSPKKRRSR